MKFIVSEMTNKLFFYVVASKSRDLPASRLSRDSRNGLSDPMCSLFAVGPNRF